MDQFNKGTDTSTTTNTTGWHNGNYCMYRLPCGVCTRTNSVCPLNGYQGPIWKLPDITCGPNAPEARLYSEGATGSGSTMGKVEAWNGISGIK